MKNSHLEQSVAEISCRFQAITHARLDVSYYNENVNSDELKNQAAAGILWSKRFAGIMLLHLGLITAVLKELNLMKSLFIEFVIIYVPLLSDPSFDFLSNTQKLLRREVKALQWIQSAWMLRYDHSWMGEKINRSWYFEFAAYINP